MRRLVALTASVLLLAGCAGRTDATTPSPALSSGPETAVASEGRGFNDTDVMFLQMMTPHHRQGIAIAALAKDRPARREVKQLAAAIRVTQRAEVKKMSGWLRSWGQPATAPAGAHADHGGMPGAADAEIDAVRRASDATFERKFLNLLIAHQDDAIQIARMETSGGVNRRTKELARRIDASRSAQIKQMLSYLRSG